MRLGRLVAAGFAAGAAAGFAGAFLRPRTLHPYHPPAGAGIPDDDAAVPGRTPSRVVTEDDVVVLRDPSIEAAG